MRLRAFARRAALGAALLATTAQAQQPAPDVGPLPRGEGTIAGQVVHPDGPAAAAGTHVVLYGLSPDGAPGVRSTQADAAGRFRFESVSTASDNVFLIGARYAEIPFFGPRVSFESGQRELAVEIAVSNPISDSSNITRGSTTIQLAWSGDALDVLENHRVVGDPEHVVVVPETHRASASPALAVPIPPAAVAFSPLPAAAADGYERDGDRVLYWGPVYPGEQDLRFGYRMLAGDGGATPAESTLVLPLPPPHGALPLRILVPDAGGLTIAAEGLVAMGSEDAPGGRFRVFELAASAPGRALRVQLPAIARDVDRVQLTRADFWLELDDTVLAVNEELSLRSDAELHVVGSASEPVLRIAIPPGAELLGISPEARQLGALPTADGVSLVGPIPPGETRVTVRYRVALSEASAGIELELPRDVEVVNVFVADTGLEIESERLHRRRPFVSGTRTYLHREAFHVTAGEAIGIVLVPLQRGRTSRSTWAAIAAIAMLAGAFFVMAPLRTPRTEMPTAAADETVWSLRRQAVVQDIRDLDHDFETGKIAPQDYEPMRARMRNEAIELLRREEATGAASLSETAQIAPEGDTGTCSGCGESVAPSARYCSNCGAALGGSRQSA